MTYNVFSGTLNLTQSINPTKYGDTALWEIGIKGWTLDEWTDGQQTDGRPDG